MDSLESSLHYLATDRGVSDQEARELAREFASRIRSLAAPEPDPDVLIREVGNDIEIILSHEDEERAREILEDHKDHGTYELDHTYSHQNGTGHCFCKVQPSDSSSSSSNEEQSIEEKFKNMDEEEREITMAKLLNQFDEG